MKDRNDWGAFYAPSLEEATRMARERAPDAVAIARCASSERYMPLRPGEAELLTKAGAKRA
jgi:hypothetical protein